MAKEFELKYRATPEILKHIEEKYGDFSPITMETVYFDTPQGDLKALKWTLRRRLENGEAVCSLKTPGDGIRRGEWEFNGWDMAAAAEELCKLGAPMQLLDYAVQGLELVCGARFTRLAVMIHLPENTHVELALDSGVFQGGGKELPFAEVEVELKSGNEDAALAFAQALAAEFSLEPETLGKAQRAMALTD